MEHWTTSFLNFNQFQVHDDTGDQTDTESNAKQYWYNILILSLFILVVIVVDVIVIVIGFKKKWHHFSEASVKQFTKTIFVVAPDSGNIKKNFWVLLLLYRIVVFAFCVFVEFYTLFHDTNGNLWVFCSFYTIWNFTMLITYFFVTNFHLFFSRKFFLIDSIFFSALF